MSDTFKYLGDNPGYGSSEGFTPMGKVLPDPDEMKAQDYLKGKMKTIANASEGVVPGGDAYEKYGKMPGEDTADSTPEKSLGAGKMSAEEVREKFGFSYNEEHANNSGGYSKYGGRDDGAIYNQKTGEYVGTIENFTPRGEDDAQGIDQFESIQDHELKHGFRSAKRTDWDSMNDVAGAVQNLLGDGEKATTATEPEKERTPIEHSAEIKEAKERVRAYEDNVMSGKTSNDIYGKSNANAKGDIFQKYQLNLNQNQATDVKPDDAEVKANEATDGFLQNKKVDVKKAYNFQPAS